MKEPIKKGDLCLVIDGVLKSKSPNIGKQVTVGMCMGEHSRLGRIWRCSGAGLMQFDGSSGDTADFPADWLQKIEPPTVTKTSTKEEEITA